MSQSPTQRPDHRVGVHLWLGTPTGSLSHFFHLRSRINIFLKQPDSVYVIKNIGDVAKDLHNQHTQGTVLRQAKNIQPSRDFLRGKYRRSGRLQVFDLGNLVPKGQLLDI